MTGLESTKDLIEMERECLRRFHTKAAEIRVAHPTMTSQISFCKAVEALHQISERYQWVRQVLQSRGIAALPLR
jgi:hypothetical protein